MLSVVVEKPNRMAARARPQPGANEVPVRVSCTDICGSDVHILHGKNSFVVYSRAISREFGGRIDNVSAARIPERPDVSIELRQV